MDVIAWLKKAQEALVMDLSALRDIKVMLHDNYAYFMTPLASVQMNMMAEDLLPYPVDEIDYAMRQWRTCGPPPGHKPRPPIPSDLIKIMRPTLDENAKANAMAAKILRCVSKFGYTQPKRAEEHMGAAAWQVVKMRGTWSDLCRTVTVDNFSSFHAQLRDSAKAVLSQSAPYLTSRGEIQETRNKALRDGGMSHLGDVLNQTCIDAEAQATP